MRRVALLVLAVLFVAPIATGGVATIAAAQNGTATPTPTATPSNATATPTPSGFEPPGPYTRDELASNGVQLGDDAPTSVREFDDGEYMLIRHFPPNPAAESSKRLSDDPDTLVRGDKLSLETVRTLPSAEARNLTVVIVYWQDETTRQNGTVVNYAANQSIQRVQVTVGTKWSSTNLTLNSHFDGPVQATMWLEEDGQRLEGATWRFVHHSVQSEQALPFENTWDGLFWWGAPRWGISTAILIIGAAYGGFQFPKRAATGFNKGFGWWIFMSMLVTAVAVAGWYADVVALVVAAPYLLSLPFAGLVFILISEWYQPAHKGLFEQPHLSETVDPTGEKVPDIEGEKGDTVHLVDLPGALGIVKSGSIGAALARYYAGYEKLDDNEIPQRFAYGGDSDISEKIYVEDYEFTPARWTFELPDLKRELTDEDDNVVGREWRAKHILMGAGFILAGTAVGVATGVGPFVGFLLGLVPIGVASCQPLPPKLDIDLSPAHATPAKAARLAEEQTRLEFDTFEKVADHIAELETSGYEEVYKILEAYRNRREEALDDLFGEGEPEERPATVGGDDD